MKTLSQSLARMFTPAAPKKPDTQRKAREESKRLAALCGCEIEKCNSGWNVWPPKAGELSDPFDGDHYAQDWAEVLVMVRHYAGKDDAQTAPAAEVQSAAPAAPVVTEPGEAYWDGAHGMDFVSNDGGRAAAGFKGKAGDCVARSIAIASGRPYAEVYAALAAGTGAQRAARGRKRAASAREGITTGRKWFKGYMASIGFTWVPTMAIGKGCTTRLLRGELPAGRLVVSVSKHCTAVIDGVIHDTFNPTRVTHHFESGQPARLSHRCVYGYWRLA